MAQVQKERSKREADEIEPLETPAKAEFDIDELLGEIDKVLEPNAQEFVQSYIQRGGELWGQSGPVQNVARQYQSQQCADLTSPDATGRQVPNIATTMATQNTLTNLRRAKRATSHLGFRSVTTTVRSVALSWAT